MVNRGNAHRLSGVLAAKKKRNEYGGWEKCGGEEEEE